MAETNAKKDEKSADIDKLTTKIDTAVAHSAKLKEEVATLQKELAELAKTQAAMDALREKESAAYAKDKPELEQGLEGVKLALQILREYYAKEDKSHEAAEGAASGIIGLLEVAESDFSTGLATMIAEEEADAAAYEKEMQENKLAKATKEQDVKYKSAEAVKLDEAVTELSGDRDTVQEELDAVLEYLKKLRDQCVAKAEPYEEKVRRREAEIAGLKQALSILEGEAVLLQRGAAHRPLRGAGRV